MATTTLGLTQFTGTDTINFLTQYNADMTKIDDSAKMSKAIGSDYIYSYTTPPSYSGGTVTVYSGTKYVCADGRDTNGDIKQTILTLSTNKTIAFSGTGDYNVYIDNSQIFSSVLTSNVGIVNFVSNLPTNVGTTAPYVYYVINEHRYYYTSGSTTASWSAKVYCKIASVRVASSTITYFKPNLQLNLAQKIGKDKLLFTMADVNANTDKEFVPSAVAVKELLATLGVDYIVERGSNANGNYEKWHSGKLVMWGVSPILIPANTQYTSKTITLPVSFADTNYIWNGTQGIIHGITALGLATFGQNSSKLVGSFSIHVKTDGTYPSDQDISMNWHAIGTYTVG